MHFEFDVCVLYSVYVNLFQGFHSSFVSMLICLVLRCVFPSMRPLFFTHFQVESLAKPYRIVPQHAFSFRNVDNFGFDGSPRPISKEMGHSWRASA